ncbi:hypothetical protein SB748_29390 [Rhizobium sp. SIMBA_035]
MEVTSTNISEQSDGKLKVAFNGEGGESIVVQMVVSGQLDDETTIQRAKELMVQVATFGVAGEQSADPSILTDISAIQTEGLEETAPASGNFASPNSVT